MIHLKYTLCNLADNMTYSIYMCQHERTFTPFLRHLECCKTVEPSPSLYLTRVKSIGKECHEITISINLVPI